MSRRMTGVIFCLISALLFSARYIAAAIFGSGVSTWNSDLFNSMLMYVGDELVTLSIISLVVGIGYLIWAELISVFGRFFDEELEKKEE